MNVTRKKPSWHCNAMETEQEVVKLSVHNQASISLDQAVLTLNNMEMKELGKNTLCFSPKSF